jgi:hypothetical protein
VSAVATRRHPWRDREGRLNKHAELVCSISADHVLDDQAATGVDLLPCVEAEDIILVDDKSVTVGDETLDLSAGEYASLGHDGKVMARDVKKGAAVR